MYLVKTEGKVMTVYILKHWIMPLPFKNVSNVHVSAEYLLWSKNFCISNCISPFPLTKLLTLVTSLTVK